MITIIDLDRVTYIGAAPITLDEAKTQLRVTFTDDDTEITALITKACKHVETHCNISIIYQRVQLIAKFEGEWKLPYGPVIGIESVQDSQGTSGSGPSTYSASTQSWSVDGDSFNPGINCLKTKVVYTTGNYCPEDLKDVILQVLTFLYDNRGKDISVSDLNKILSNADSYKVMLWI